MRILITGATGMIGSRLTKLCREKGIAVNYLTTSKEKINSSPTYTGYYWGPKTGEIDLASLENVNAVIHLAGANIAQRWTKSNKREILESRTLSAELLKKTMKETPHQVRKFISASGISIYPDSLEKLYTEEDGSMANTFLGEVVISWEKAADEFNELGISVTKLRTGMVLSDKGGALAKIKEPSEFGVGAAVGSGKQWQSWIHIDDLAAMYLFVLEMELAGVYNAVAPNPVTNSELTKEIAKTIGKSVWLPNVPGVALKIALGEMASVVLESQRVSSDKIEQEGFEFKYKNLPKALEDLL